MQNMPSCINFSIWRLLLRGYSNLFHQVNAMKNAPLVKKWPIKEIAIECYIYMRLTMMNMRDKFKNQLSLIGSVENCKNTSILFGWRVLKVLNVLTNYFSISYQISSSINHVAHQHYLIARRVRKFKRILSRFKIIRQYSQRWFCQHLSLASHLDYLRTLKNKRIPPRYPDLSIDCNPSMIWYIKFSQLYDVRVQCTIILLLII